MARRIKNVSEEELTGRLTDRAAEYEALPAEELTRMAAAAVRYGARTETPAPRKLFSLRSAPLLAALVGVLALSAPLLAAGIDRLQGIANRTGVEELGPSSPDPAYTPADEPYISVQPLMRYVGADEPVVPRAAVTERGGRQVVFTIESAGYTSTDKYEQLTVRTNPVTTGETYGRAILITSGLNPCAIVLVEPSEELQDGDRIRSYAQGSDEGPAIDYHTLFDGREEAPPPEIEGGISHEENGQVVLVITHNGSSPPQGSSYEVETADGGVYEAPYRDVAEVHVPPETLRQGQPLAKAQLLTPSGETIARGLLDWYCSP